MMIYIVLSLLLAASIAYFYSLVATYDDLDRYRQ